MPLSTRRSRRRPPFATLALLCGLPLAAGAQSAIAGSVRAPGDSLAAVTLGASAPAWAVGSSRAVIDSAAIAHAAATTLSELIQARAPSVSVMRSGGLLTQSGQIRMRGPTSVLQRALPLLVVDGVPMDAEQEDSLTVASRLDDIPLADVARVELLRGPAAAALYGAGAASGAIIVTTRAGGAHPLRWRATGDASASQSSDAFGVVYQGLGTTTSGTATDECGLFALVRRACTQTGIRRWNPVRASGFMRTGLGVGSALEASGGSAATHGRLSVARSDATGVTGDDEASRTSTRLDLGQRILPSLHATARVGFVRGRSQPSRSDQLFGGAFRLGLSLDTASAMRRYADSLLALPALVGHLDHLTTALGLEWHPLGAVVVRGLAARDRVDERAAAGFPRLQADTVFDTRTTSRTLRSTRAELEAAHRVVGATGTLLVAVEHQHTAGGARVAEVLNVPGIFSIRAVRWTANTNAVLAQERLAWGDRAALGAGVRYERDYLVGDAWRAYPTVDASWRLTSGWHGGSVRLRGAYGEAPQRAARSCSPYYAPTGSPTGGAAILCDRSPERSGEAELGLDATFPRAAVALTGFRTLVRDVWVPDLFAPTNAVVFRRDRVLDQGIELDAEAMVLDRPGARWQLGVVAATLGNRLLAPELPLITALSTGGALRGGAPVWGARTTDYQFSDANGDGMISFGELTGGAFDIAGRSSPSLEASLHSTLDLSRGLTLGAIVDGRRGYQARDVLQALKCASQHCLDVVDPTAPLADQAAGLASAATSGLPEDASFWRLREVSARWQLPAGAAGRVGARDGAIIVAGRDLATWTRFGGGDPEIDDNPRAAVARSVVAGLPIPRQLIFRVELDYGDR